jgi:adenylate cyclase
VDRQPTLTASAALPYNPGAMRAVLRSPITAALAASVVIFLALIGLRKTGYLESLELTAYDWQIRMRPTTTESASRVVLVLVTEQDIDRLKQWPLSDAILADALEKLARYGSRAVVVDIYRDVTVPPGHQELVKVLTTYKQIIGAMKFPNANSPGVGPPEVLQGTDQVGFSDMVVDPGGIVRRGLLFLDDGKTVYYSMALRAALLYLQAKGIAVQNDPDNPAYIRFGSTTFRPFEANDGPYVNADAGGYQFLLDYRDNVDVYPTLTLGQLLDGIFDPAMFKDKVILIGLGAESVKDYFYTPYSPASEVYGVAVHAHIVSQLLRAAIDGDKPTAFISNRSESLWILLWCLLGGALGLLVRSAWRFVLAATAGLILLTVIMQGLFVLGWWIPLVPPGLGWIGSAGLIMAYVSSREKKERSNLMNLFSSYTSEQLAAAIWQDREKFLSGGRPRPQRLTATAFFSDIASFTTISEKLDPPTLMDWLNEYMEAMSPLVGEHNGVILRFIGDAIMAMFGVPVARTTEEAIRQDAINGVSCALAMQQRLIELNRSLNERGLPMIGMRMGLLTGPMVAGTLGSAKRLEYNVHGDTVNTAARLESFEKENFAPDHLNSPCRILIGQPTVDLVGEEFVTELVGEVRLKGKEHGTRIYRVLGRRGGDPGEQRGEKHEPGAIEEKPARVASGAPN